MKEFKEEYLSTNKRIHTISSQLLRAHATCNDISQADSDRDDDQKIDDSQFLMVHSSSENIPAIQNI